MGESVTEGSIVEWRKNVGDWVEDGETLVDVTTDKVDVEVPSTARGVITAIHGAEGDTVAVGTVLVEIDPTAVHPDGSPAAAAVPAAPAARAAAPPAASAREATPSGYGSAGSADAPPVRHSNGNGGLHGVASHKAQLIAQRHHLDLASIAGTGPDGLILRDDVERALAAGGAKPVAANGAAPHAAAPAAPAAPAFPPPGVRAKVTELKGALGTLASYMDASLTIPTATSFRTLGVGLLEARRSQLNAALKRANRSEKVSFTHLIAYALVRAARDVPAMTAAFRRENGKPQKIEAGIHLGLAVDAQRKDGSRFLVVPVIKNADARSFAEFRAAYEDLVVKARDGKLSVDEQTGATFTLTNPGGIGTIASVPRLMVGQGAIVAAGAIAFPPGFAHASPEALAQLGVEKIMTLTSTYDHRVIQGAQSGEFLKRVDELLGGADAFYENIFAEISGGTHDGAADSAAVAMPVSVAERATAESAVSGSIAGSDELARAIAAGMALVSSYRRHGHLAATLDPLGTKPQGDPSLDSSNYHLTPAYMNAVPASVLRVKVPGATLADVLPRLRDVYSSTIAYEVEHISNTAQREWLREYIESGRHRRELPAQRKIQVLERLTKVETMERYFRKQFLSQKTFSIEGLDMMVPMLEEIISMLAEEGTQIIVIGMAHRGRLSTIAHVVNRKYEELLAEFESGAIKPAEPIGGDLDDVTGDVKYHHGANGVYVTPAGTKIDVKLANNPSHLEAVDGVVEGITRALQTDHRRNPATLDFTTAAPILIHGDAAFAAQGVVAEVLNLQALTGYSTGGTIHIISNNQVGFTTDPHEGRSTRYSSDLAKGYDVPIVHVNADDVEACIAAVRLAIDYRAKFGRDTVIDLIGYRRFGHNEQDEPAYTQPLMYEAVKSHPTVRELFAAQLTAQGVISADEVKAMQEAAGARMIEAHRNVREGGHQHKLIAAARPAAGRSEPPPATGVPRERLLAYATQVIATPPGFALNKKLQSQFAKRQAALTADGEVDWGLAEGLAFASLLAEGTPIRLTGQDVERGTFSHRHAVLHDMQTDVKHVPLQHLADAKASFEIYNSPLSEYACLGFEYGYGGVVPDALVLWEAQFGDFNNGAQIIIDQFIAAGAAKWGQDTRLTLLLPHGYEGAGPEHSSARLERFLQLSAEGNIRVANCSTSAQYFHLLRSQAKARHAYPLVVMTPKSLLRNRSAFGTLDELANGSFHEIIDDARLAAKREAVNRLLLCSGKIYHDLAADSAFAALERTAVARVELLSPLPKRALLALFASYPNLKRVVWVQEEPKNMGARAHVRRRLMDDLPTNIVDIEYIGRPYRASPSEGYPGAHAVEQERIVRTALVED